MPSACQSSPPTKAGDIFKSRREKSWSFKGHEHISSSFKENALNSLYLLFPIPKFGSIDRFLEVGAMHFISTLLLLLFLSLLSAGKAQNSGMRNMSELNEAVAEMKGGSYFAFVMLLQMLVESGTPIPTTDVTFLIPSDIHLADHSSITLNQLPAFLLRHTLTPQLKFHTLQHLPNATILPSSLPNYTLTVSNNGRRNFSLNNAQIVFPNVCRSSPSIACHGISDVLTATTTHYSPPPPPPPSPPPHSPAPLPLSPPLPSSPPAPAPASASGHYPSLYPAPAPSSSNHSPTPTPCISLLLLFLCTIALALSHP